MRDKQNGYIYYDYHRKTEKEDIAETAWTSVFHWLYAIVGFLFVVFVAFGVFFKVFAVDGDSMTPTLNDGDDLLVYSLDYTPSAGDIVLIGAMDETEQVLVKRIIATEDQTVEIDYKTGTLLVDGIEIHEDYITDMSLHANNEISYPYTVPKGCVFVLGDNRNESKDSRNKGIQAIDEARIVGKVIIRLYPFSDMNIYE